MYFQLHSLSQSRDLWYRAHSALGYKTIVPWLVIVIMEFLCMRGRSGFCERQIEIQRKRRPEEGLGGFCLDGQDHCPCIVFHRTFRI